MTAIFSLFVHAGIQTTLRLGVLESLFTFLTVAEDNASI